MRRLIFIFVLWLISPLPGWAGQIVVPYLPYTISAHSAAYNAGTHTMDTVMINPDSGNALHSARTGIICNQLVNNANDSLYFDFRGNDGIAGTIDDDSIVFGMDSSSYSSSAYLGVIGLLLCGHGSGETKEVTIAGGYIVHKPTGVSENSDYGVIGKCAQNASGIVSYNNTRNITIEGTTIVVTGFGAVQGPGTSTGSHGIFYRGHGLYLHNAKIFTKHYGYDSRMSYCSNTINFAVSTSGPDPLDAGSPYHLRMVACSLNAIGHNNVNYAGVNGDNQGTYYLGVCQIDSCALVIDNNNTYFAGEGAYGYTNGWNVHYRCAGSQSPYFSYIRNSRFYSGTQFGGGRGIEVRECNSRVDNSNTHFIGWWPDTVDISNNRFIRQHQGMDLEYNDKWAGMNVKIRRGNGHVRFHDNVLSFVLDTFTAAHENYYTTGTNIGFQIEMDGDDSSRAPYDTDVYDNICSLLVGRHYGSGFPYLWGCCLYWSSSPGNVAAHGLDSTTNIFGNTFYTEVGSSFGFGSQWDSDGRWMLVGSNTYSATDDSGWFKGTFNLTGQGPGISSQPSPWGNINCNVLDPIYAGDAGQTFSHWCRDATIGHCTGCSHELMLWRTYKLYVKGNNGLPVWGADVYIVDSLGATVGSGTTNYNGLYQDTVKYYYYEWVAADTSYNRFHIMANESADWTDAWINVGWTAAGGTDTLTLNNTSGTGDWEEEPPPPAGDSTRSIYFRGMKMRGVKISYESDQDMDDCRLATLCRRN